MLLFGYRWRFLKIKTLQRLDYSGTFYSAFLCTIVRYLQITRSYKIHVSIYLLSQSKDVKNLKFTTSCLQHFVTDRSPTSDNKSTLLTFSPWFDIRYLNHTWPQVTYLTCPPARAPHLRESVTVLTSLLLHCSPHTICLLCLCSFYLKLLAKLSSTRNASQIQV